MMLWRISNYADLKGTGGLKYAARWHNKGIPVVYLSETAALAMLEALVHFEFAPDELPETYQLLEIDYPHSSGLSTISDDLLGEGWQQDIDFTRAIGDEWLISNSSVLLRVPSAILPHSYNYLFNPRHPDAKKAQITSVIKQPYDGRLMQE